MTINWGGLGILAALAGVAYVIKASVGKPRAKAKVSTRNPLLAAGIVKGAFNPCTMAPPGRGPEFRVGNPVFDGLLITLSNDKLGEMVNWSLPYGPTKTGGSCPGSSEWCKEFCYAAGGQVAMHRKEYTQNLKESKKPDFADRMIRAIRSLGNGTARYMGMDKKKGMLVEKRVPRVKDKTFRLHVSGDFYSVKYVNDWIKITKALKDDGWRFYTYTRCWRPQAQKEAPGILSAIRNLKKLSNVEIMASTDPKTGPAPSDFRESGVDGCWGGDCIICPNLSTRIRAARKAKGLKPITCAECYRCGNKKAKGIFLPVHGIGGKEKTQLHQEMVAAARPKGFKLGKTSNPRDLQLVNNPKKCTIRRDLLQAGLSVPVGGGRYTSQKRNFEYRWVGDDKFQIKHNGKWVSASSIDFDFSTNPRDLQLINNPRIKTSKAYRDAVEQINNGTLNCPKCHSDIIKAIPGAAGKLECRMCGYMWKFRG